VSLFLTEERINVVEMLKEKKGLSLKEKTSIKNQSFVIIIITIIIITIIIMIIMIIIIMTIIIIIIIIIIITIIIIIITRQWGRTGWCLSLLREDGRSRPP